MCRYRCPVGEGASHPHPGPSAVAEGSGFRAVYVGGGAHEEDVKAKVRQIAPESIFVAPVEQIGNALAALDVFMLASPSEGFSLALTEAWLCGVPTVATRVGAVPELEEMHGQLVVPVSVGAGPAELAAAVRRALSAEGREVAERARRIAWRHYTAGAMGQRWTEFLVQAFQRGGAPPPVVPSLVAGFFPELAGTRPGATSRSARRGAERLFAERHRGRSLQILVVGRRVSIAKTLPRRETE